MRRCICSTARWMTPACARFFSSGMSSSSRAPAMLMVFSGLRRSWLTTPSTWSRALTALRASSYRRRISASACLRSVTSSTIA